MSIGGAGAADADLRGHFYLADVDSHGRVVAAVAEASRIVYIDGRGHKVDSFQVEVQEGPCNVTTNGKGYTIVQACPPNEKTTLAFDRTHHLIRVWNDTFEPNAPPRFGPRGDVFAIDRNGTILKLKVALPGA